MSVIAVLFLRIRHNFFQPLQAEIQNAQIKPTNRATALSVNAVIVDSVTIGTNIIFGRQILSCHMPCCWALAFASSDFLYSLSGIGRIAAFWHDCLFAPACLLVPKNLKCCLGIFRIENRLQGGGCAIIQKQTILVS